MAIAEKQAVIDGIAVISDGGENRGPFFADVYRAYSAAIGKEVPVYLYRTAGEADVFSGNLERAKIDCQKFDLSGGTVDYYALPGIITTMRTRRYGLVEEIMDTPLLTLEEVLGHAKNSEKEYAHA
jgi:hypothetical protein